MDGHESPQQDRIDALERGMAALTERIERLEGAQAGVVLVYDVAAVELEDLAWFDGPKVPTYAAGGPPVRFASTSGDHGELPGGEAQVARMLAWEKLSWVDQESYLKQAHLLVRAAERTAEAAG